MAVTVVQHAEATALATTVAATLGGAVSAGNLLVVFVGLKSGGALNDGIWLTPTDSSGNTYLPAKTFNTLSAINGGVGMKAYYAENIAAAGAGANVVTATCSPSQTMTIQVIELAGAAASKTFDGQAAATGATTGMTAGALNTTCPNDLIIGAFAAGSVATAPGSGFTTINIGPTSGNLLESHAVTATGTYTATGTQTSATAYAGLTIAFRAAGDPVPIVCLQMNAHTFGSGNQTSVTVALAGTRAGNAVIVAVTGNTAGSDVSGVADTVNAYAVAGARVVNTPNAVWGKAYYAKNISGGSITITVTLGSTFATDVRAYEWQGLDTAAPLDQATGATGASTTQSSGNVTTTQARELVFGYCGTAGGPATAGSGFTLLQATSPNGDADEFKIVFAVGAVNAVFNPAGAGVVQVATFAGAAAAPLLRRTLGPRVGSRTVRPTA
jgi:hypothetical protein